MIFSQSVSDREWEPVFIFKCISFVADELGTPGKQCFLSGLTIRLRFSMGR